MGSSRLEVERDITARLKRNLRGKWASVLPLVLPELMDAVEAGYRKHVDCPYHGGKDDFRILKDFNENGGCICSCNKHMADGFKVIMYAKNCDFMEAKNLLIEALGGSLRTDHIPVRREPRVSRKSKEAQYARIRTRIQRVWQECIPLGNKEAAPVRNWLTQRGVGHRTQFPSITYHPRLAYWDHVNGKAKCLGRFPAMVAMVSRPNGKTATIHRTFLSKDGKAKADVPQARKLEESPSEASLGGSAIRIDHNVGAVLSVAEGIETALSARLLTADLKVPVWSTLNAGLMEQLVVPDHVEVIVIWADRDRSQAGQAAAIALCERLREEGRKAVVMLPPYAIPEGQKSLDWNDVIRIEGPEAARAHPAFVRFRKRLIDIMKDVSQQRRAS